MKIIHYINYAFVALTVILYVIIGYQAILAQFFLACFQLVTALVLTLLFKKFSQQQTIKLFYYWMSVIIWFVLTLSLQSLKLSFFEPVFITIIPMCIACYFVYVTYLHSLTHKHHEP
jgi:hypothetical protein